MSPEAKRSTNMLCRMTSEGCRRDDGDHRRFCATRDARRAYADALGANADVRQTAASYLKFDPGLPRVILVISQSTG